MLMRGLTEDMITCHQRKSIFIIYQCLTKKRFTEYATTEQISELGEGTLPQKNNVCFYGKS